MVTLDALEALAPRLQRTAEAIAADAEAWCFPDTDSKKTGT